MKQSWILVIAIALLTCRFSSGQQSVTSGASATVPSLVNYTGTLTDNSGKAISSLVGVTFSLYRDKQGGSPLWIETQNVQPDKNGRYTVQLGASSTQGLPNDLFSSGEARWLGVQPEGQVEQPRVMLLSVPYAMKAGDATTVGGLPASAFAKADAHGAPSGNKPGVETPNFIPLFVDSSGDLGNSILFQSGTTEVGINTTTPSATLEVNGTTKFDGLASFASGQTFPGTLTGITAGTGITVGGSKTSPTVGINTTFANQFYAQLKAPNTFTANQTVNGTMTATTFSGSGSGITNVNAASLNGLPATAFSQLGFGNTYQSSPLGTAIPQILAPVNNATTTSGFNSNPFDLAASSYNSAAAAAQKETFRWQTEPAGNNTSSPSGTLNLLFGANGATPTETGLNIAGNGQITFASGQTFPGVGTISGITAGTDLTGGGTTGNVTLNLNLAATDARYAQLGVANNFTGNQVINGNLTTNGSFTAQAGNFDATSSTPLLSISQTGTGTGVNIAASTGFAGLIATGNEIGVSGTATNTNGMGASGLEGFATGGNGVFGSDNAVKGASVGVAGASTSPIGIGVLGAAPFINGGIATPPQPTGLMGVAELGVLGESPVINGIGGSFTGGPSGSLAGQTGGTGVTAEGGSDPNDNVGGEGGAFFGGSSNNIPGSGATFNGGDNTSLGAPGFGLSAAAGVGSTGSLGGYPIAGVWGIGPFDSTSKAYLGPGILGTDNALSGNSGNYLNNDLGVWGDSGAGFAGVLATADNTYALVASNNSTNLPALRARNRSTNGTASGLQVAVDALNGEVNLGGAGCGANYWGLQLGQSGMSNCNNYTLMGDGSNTFINAGSGTQTGTIYFRINNNNSPNAMTVNNNGSVTIATLDVTTKLTKPAGSFKIDHPLDPANKFLYHSFVESPDMMNIYNGVAQLDASGEAVVALPEYFQALNRDFRYQLTSIGGPGPNLYIAEEIENNHFRIAGGKPGAKVSWQVTGIRQDAFANAYRIQVEVEKTAEERGRYLHPELFGAPQEDRIGYAMPAPPLYPKGDSLEIRPTPRPAGVSSLRRRRPPRLSTPMLPQPPALKTPVKHSMTQASR